MIRTLIAFLAVLVLAGGTSHAQGAKLAPEAQRHLDAALVAYNAKDYPTAIREFDLAYQIDPNPALLYATAQAHRFSGNCPTALELYARYLETRPNETQIEATRVGVAACGDVAPRPAPTEPAPTAPSVQPAPAPTVVEPPAPVGGPHADDGPQPWYTDKLGGALTISGLAGIGVGISFLAMANSSEQRAQTAEFRDDFLQARDEASSRRRMGAISLVAGSALAVSGILVYVVRDRGPGRRIVGGTDGRTLFLAGRF